MHMRTELLLFAFFLKFCSALEGPHVVARAPEVVPAPVVVSASQFFEGNDGPWSSFELRVGNPAQNVRVLPGTSSTSTIVVLPERCQSGEPSSCANASGGIFNTTASSTWSNIGIYGLGFESSLGYTDAGQFGFDAVGLGYQGSGGPTINHSVIAGVAGTEFYLGILGMNPQPTNFTDLNDPQPSYLTLLKKQNDIPSLSYSYTAGAPYRAKQALGSLILGGYDTSRFTDTNFSFTFFSDQTRDLTVGLQSITTNMTGFSETNLLSSSIYAFIDSSIAQIYLPVSVCQAFEAVFSLTYNTTAGLYLVNDTWHEKLLLQNPSVTFTIGNTVSGGPTINVTLPYASFDLQAEYPLVSNSSRYFPLQRATNDSQYTLGRTFLQEAYLIVDYERSNFSVHPCVWDIDAAAHVVSIPGVNTTDSANSTTTGDGGSPGNTGNNGSGGGSSSSSGSSSKSLSTGAIAGIVIGALFITIAILGSLLWFLVLVPRRKMSGAVEGAAVPELAGDFKAEEVEGSVPGKELYDSAHPVGVELAARPPEVEGAQIYELAGCDVPEMAVGQETSASAREEKDRKRFSWESP